MSCNFTVLRWESDLATDLLARYVAIEEERLDLLRHLEDQIYGDSAFQRVLGLPDGRRPQARAGARGIPYPLRLTVGHRPTRRVLVLRKGKLGKGGRSRAAASLAGAADEGRAP
ncbi:MAG: hypothetical protein ACREV3_11480 [Gammaproteobacteria bacterium]